jgi:hypothetical protein
MSDLVNYFRSWSSVQNFIEENNYDPVSKILDSLENAWGGEHRINEKRKVSWPLYVKAGIL